MNSLLIDCRFTVFTGSTTSFYFLAAEFLPDAVVVSLLHKLHLSAGKFKHVTIFKGNWLAPNSGTVQGRLAGTLDMRYDKAVGPARDRKSVV